MITRRRTMIGTAALVVTAAAPAAQRAEAAARRQPSRAIAFRRVTVGELEVTLLFDGHARRPLDAGFVRNAPLPEVQRALADVFQPTDALLIPFTVTLVNTGSTLVLLDAGQVRAALAAAGYTPEQVDLVVVSHFHGDHINGLRSEEGEFLYPNARLLVPELEWEFWMDDGQMSRVPEGMKGAFQNLRRVFGAIAGSIERYGGEREIVPGISAVPGTRSHARA
jgi:hypothetical protein